MMRQGSFLLFELPALLRRCVVGAVDVAGPLSVLGPDFDCAMAAGSLINRSKISEL